MITKLDLAGEPGVLPWTSGSLRAAAEAVCRDKRGRVWQSAGKTFARSIASVPGCRFAALDIGSGLILASQSAIARDAALDAVGETALVCNWFEILPDPAERTHATFPHALPAVGPASGLDFGESVSLAERVDIYLARVADATGGGAIAWFAADGELGQRLAVLGAFGGTREDLDRFSGILLSADESGLLALVSNASALEAGAVRLPFAAILETDVARGFWLACAQADGRLESGDVPAWESLASVSSIETHTTAEP